MRPHGWPLHTVEEYKRFVGNGIPRLVERFAPAPERHAGGAGPGPGGVSRSAYGRPQADKTAPYAGMPEAVERLRAAGVRTAVLSNKAHALAGRWWRTTTRGSSLGAGALPALPTKPDPTLLHRLMEQMGASPEDTLFVGDSDVDIRTARNGGLTSCGVLWGFRGRAELEAEGADCLARTPGGAGKGGAGRWLRLF